MFCKKETIKTKMIFSLLTVTAAALGTYSCTVPNPNYNRIYLAAIES
jgi:hypothetical protein